MYFYIELYVKIHVLKTFMNYEELFEQMAKQGLIEVLGDEAFKAYHKFVGSAENIAEGIEAATTLLTVSNQNIGVISNSMIVGLGAYTGGNSLIQYTITSDYKAKVFYSLSTLFSASAMTSGGMAVMARACQISETAALSEALGMALMHLGNKAHVAALELENKPVPPHLEKYANKRRLLRRAAYDLNGLSFIMPRDLGMSDLIVKIPFEKIGRIVGVGIALYSYSKLFIMGYRYGQQFLTKFQTKRKSKLLAEKAKFLLSATKTCPSYRKIKLIYRFTVKPTYLYSL